MKRLAQGHGAQGGREGTSIPDAFQMPSPLRHTWRAWVACAHPVFTLLYPFPTCFHAQVTAAAHSFPGSWARQDWGHALTLTTQVRKPRAREMVIKKADLRAWAHSEYI